MSYSGVRGSSLLGQFGRLATSAITVLLQTAVFVFAIAHTHRGDSLLVLGGTYVLSLVIAVVIHEAGHLVVGLAVGEPARQLRIGSGATLFGFRIGKVLIQICINPLGGGAVYFSSVGSMPGLTRLASLAAGPGINLLAAAYALALWQSGVTWLGVFAVANADAFIAAAMPSMTIVGGRRHKTDGMQILDVLLRPSQPAMFFDGSDLSDDARAVLMRSLESAQLAGLLEVTDQDLLRALAQDAAVSEVFKSAGLERIPESPEPESDEMPSPRWSRTVSAILDTAFHKSRDLGNPRPNAAGLCLGLLAIECPASRLLKDAGITEDALKSLAAVESEDAGSMRREQVITADLPLERWGTAADGALARAFKIAAADRSSYVGTQHIVAALLADPSCRAAQALARMRFALEWKPLASTEIQEPKGGPQLSVQAAIAVAGALWRTGQNYPTGSAELCLGILDQSAGMGAEMLLSAGVTVDGFIKALRSTERELSQPAGCTPAIRQMWERRAFARMRAERWADSRSDFLVVEQTATTDRQRALGRNNIAWVSLMANDPSLRQSALDLSGSARALEPDLLPIIGTHAFALLENGSPAEAAALLEPVATKHARPRDRASDLSLLSMCYSRLGRFEEATQTLAAARAADPKCALLARAQAEVTRQGAMPVG